MIIASRRTSKSLRADPHLVYDTDIMTRTNGILSNITGLSSPIDVCLPLLLLRLTRP